MDMAAVSGVQMDTGVLAVAANIDMDCWIMAAAKRC